MNKNNLPVKQSKNLINTYNATRKSETNKNDLQVFEDIGQGQLKAVESLDELKKAVFECSGAMPFLFDGISQLCTINPALPNGEMVIKRQDDKNETHYFARLKWETLVDMCTDNNPTVKDMFRHEFLSMFIKPPTTYVSLGNGKSVLTHPFIIQNIYYIDHTEMDQKDAEVCKRLGITKKISYVDIEFFKPLFYASINPNGNHTGYITKDKAFYTKTIQTVYDIKADAELTKKFTRFYNPKTGEYVQKDLKIYYKFINYFLMHLSENEQTDHTTLDALEMLREVDPHQILLKDGKEYIRNKYDTKLFIDKACQLFNIMAEKGYCEYVQGVPTYCKYNQNDNKYIIYFQREKPRTNVKEYSSNFMEEEISNNTPLNIKWNDADNSHKSSI